MRCTSFIGRLAGRGGLAPGLVVAALGGLLPLGCDNMYQQARNDPLEPNPYFADGMSARPLVAGTVPRGAAQVNEALENGSDHGRLLDRFPFAVTASDLERGRQRFNIYCSPCHGATGDGDGMIVRRGFVRPPSYHTDRLRDAPAGHLFQVITYGWGAMYSYGERVAPEDRWRVVAYIRALQMSRNMPVGQLSPRDVDRLREASSP
jgi:mono/diheme cytochrome c family protein